jgi:hypothetical protein
MKLLSVVCALGFVIVVVALAPAQENRTDQAAAGEDVPMPQLVLDELSHHFGEVKPGTPLRWAFKIKNIGTANLQIRDVKPG